MDTILKIPSSSSIHHLIHGTCCQFKCPNLGFRNGQNFVVKVFAKPSTNGFVCCNSSPGAGSSACRDVHGQRSGLESLFRYDKAIPEQIIEKPVGLSIAEKEIGDHPRCNDCEAKGALLCATCSGSGLYVDSILESQGIIVKVRCLGCGGTGNIMCSECGGRGHV